MKPRSTILIVLFLQLFSLHTHAQEKKNMERVIAHFRVITGYYSNDSIYAIIGGGSNQGIRPGEALDIYAKYVAGVRNRHHLAYGKVARLFPDSAVCAIKLVKTGTHGDSVLLGDLAQVTIDLPIKKYSTIYHDLARFNVYFKDINGDLVFNFPFLYNLDNPKADSILSNYLLNDLKKAYEKYKGKITDTSLLRPLRDEGRFKGVVPFEMLNTATIEDVKSFLEYTASFQVEYMSYDYGFASVFVAWVSRNPTYGTREVYRKLFPIYKDRAKLDALLPEYTPSILAESMVRKWVDSMTNMLDAGRLDNAKNVEGFVRVLTERIKDTTGKAYLMLALAKSEFDKNNFRRSIEYADSAILIARSSRNYTIEFDACLKKVDALGNLPDMPVAKQTLMDMETRLNLYKKSMGETDYKVYLQKRYQYDGWVNYKGGDYGPAAKLYLIAADMNNRIISYDSRSNNALIYKNLGLIYKAQGKNEEALKAFSSSMQLYDSLNDIPSRTVVWNEMGVVNYNMGNYPKALQWFKDAELYFHGSGDWDNLGYAVSMKANCYWMMGKTDSAILFHNAAIEFRRDVNQKGVAYSLDQLGLLYQETGNKTKALRAFQESREIYSSLKDSISLSENLINVGIVYHSDENYKTAVEYYKEAIGSTSKVSNTALYNIGIAYRELDRNLAITYLEKAEKACDSSKDFSLQFKVLYMLNDIYSSFKETAKADNALRKMQKLMKDIGTPARQAQLYRLRGLDFERKSMFDSSIAYYKKALSIYDTTSKQDAVYVMHNIGNVDISNGEFDDAQKWFTKALDLSGEIKSPMGQAMSYNMLAFLDAELGELDKGLIASDSSMAISLRNGNIIRYAGSGVNKGMLYVRKGNFKKALEMILYADSVYIAQGVEDYRVTTLNNAGVVYYNQADYAKAIEYFERSVKYFQKSEPDESIILNRSNIAECYYYQKKYKEALAILNEYYPQAVKKKILRIGMGMAHIMGNIYYDIGDMDKAGDYAKQSYDLSVKSGSAVNMIESMVLMGKVDMHKGRMDSAEKILRAAVEKSSTTGIVNGSWLSYYELGMVFYNQKKYDSAIANFRQAVDIVERSSGNVYGGEEARKLFSSDARKVDLYNKIIASFVAVKDPAKASEYALRNSITAVNSKYGKDLGFADSTLKADLAKAEDFQHQISAVDASMAKADTKEKRDALQKTKHILEEGYQNFIDERKEKYNDFEKYIRGGVNPEDLSNYKGGLPDDMAVISYVINDSQLYKFIVTNTTLEIVTTVLDEDINVMVNEFISTLNAPDSASGTGSLKVRADFADEQKYAKKSFKEISEKLYHVLIEDMLPVIGDKKKLCIIPSGKLSNIPFQCLGKSTGGKFRFLLEDYRVFYTNRMDMFRSKEVSDRDISNMAAFGNPDKSLEYAKQEVMDIQKISHAKQVFVEDKATEQEARTALLQKKYIHFATHGTLDYVKPKQSYLTFTASAGGIDDGRLTISEIDSLKIPGQYAELVTLSACETARPLAISEDWYVSPANSFLRKKFKTVVASLWKVNDEATGLLMTEFYKNLEKMDKVDALRLAQEKLSKNPKYVHPYYWGGFVLYGDWR